MYESYLTIKTFHVATVILSLCIFSVRGTMMLVSKGNYRHKYWRLISAFNDSLLLVLGGYLSYINSVVWQIAWFQEKMLFLFLYIIFGTLAINRLRNRLSRQITLLLAFICAGHTLQLALYKTTWVL
ncbi:MAG: SirB2 family protein [Gammaproteobacteria bacterium]|nr:SirB2 family protein [Gammaproteobacteria bacterium]NNJ72518.1 SirB2 family protein [Enterobacterales bacterium]